MTEKVKRSMGQLTLQWIHQLWDAGVQGGAGATLAALGLAGASSMGIQVQPLDYKQTGAIFLSGAAIEVLRYLRSKPSPDLEGSETGQQDTSNTTGK